MDIDTVPFRDLFFRLSIQLWGHVESAIVQKFAQQLLYFACSGELIESDPWGKTNGRHWFTVVGPLSDQFSQSQRWRWGTQSAAA
jgi:hypothetical protein